MLGLSNFLTFQTFGAKQKYLVRINSTDYLCGLPCQTKSCVLATDAPTQVVAQVTIRPGSSSRANIVSRGISHATNERCTSATSLEYALTQKEGGGCLRPKADPSRSPPHHAQHRRASGTPVSALVMTAFRGGRLREWAGSRSGLGRGCRDEDPLRDSGQALRVSGQAGASLKAKCRSRFSARDDSVKRDSSTARRDRKSQRRDFRTKASRRFAQNDRSPRAAGRLSGVANGVV